MKKILKSALLGAICLSTFATISNAQVEETTYALDVRGWNVFAASDFNGFAYCFARRSDGQNNYRLAWDRRSWSLGTNYLHSSSNFNTDLEIGNQRYTVQGKNEGDYSVLTLGAGEIAAIKAGSVAYWDIHNATIEMSLRGTTAAILKVEECVQREGVEMSHGGSTHNAAPTVVESDTARLGGNCPDLGSNASRDLGGPATIEFDFQVTDGPALGIYWIDQNGIIIDTGALFSSRETPTVLQTYVGHRFIVKDQGGTCYGGVYEAQSGNSYYVVR